MIILHVNNHGAKLFSNQSHEITKCLCQHLNKRSVSIPQRLRVQKEHLGDEAEPYTWLHSEFCWILLWIILLFLLVFLSGILRSNRIVILVRCREERPEEQLTSTKPRSCPKLVRSRRVVRIRGYLRQHCLDWELYSRSSVGWPLVASSQWVDLWRTF